MTPDRTIEHSRALAEITRRITLSLEAEEVVDALKREAQRILPHERLWLLLRSIRADGPEEWTIAIASPPAPDFPPAFPLSDASFSAELLAARPVLVADFAQTAVTARFDRAILDVGGRSAVVAPIHVASRTLGGLIFTRSTPGAYAATDVEWIQPVTGLLALALEHERLDHQASALAVVEERNRLAREIHDTLAQSLTAIILNLEALKLDTAKRSASDRGILEETEALARSALIEARRSVLGLHPATLAHQSLGRALAEELAAFGRRAGVATHLYVHGVERDLTPDQATALFRIAQEALQNVYKYAAARTVLIGLTYGTETVTLAVEDDGIGFAPDALSEPNTHGGSGLLGMEARARSLGGTLAVTSQPGHGVRVEATLPHDRPSIASVVRLGAPEGTTRAAPIRILIVDDHPVTRQGLLRILEAQPDLTVVGEAQDGVAAVAAAHALTPDVALVDLQMPRLGGLAAIPQLRAACPQLEVVVLTTFDQEEHVFAALKAGARGYILKDASPNALLATIRAAARGESLLPIDVATRVVQRFVALAHRETDPDALNTREMEVLRLIALGKPYKEIGVRLHITTKTVQYHVGNILGKLHVRSRGEAVAVALERGLLDGNA